MLQLIVNILVALVSGDFKSLWQAHKLKEGKDAQAKVDALSDTDVERVLKDDWTRPN